MTTKRIAPIMIALALAAAACGGSDDASPATEAPAPATEPAATEPAATEPAATEPAATDEPVTGPATISGSDQSGDGSSVIASVSLPTGGFIAVHADLDGGPGPVIGSSELLSAGDNADVVIQLATPIDADTPVWPMAHVDANGNGVYEFAPPDVAIDVPALTADGSVAVVSLNYTVDAGSSDAAGLTLGSTALGDALIDSNGLTLYLFTPDAQGAPTCSGDCAATWPVVAEVSSVGDGLDASLLGSADREDGTTQATYNDWPLYTFAGDAGPGDVNGHTVGDVWFALDADGNAFAG